MKRKAGSRKEADRLLRVISGACVVMMWSSTGGQEAVRIQDIIPRDSRVRPTYQIEALLFGVGPGRAADCKRSLRLFQMASNTRIMMMETSLHYSSHQKKFFRVLQNGRKNTALLSVSGRKPKVMRTVSQLEGRPKLRVWRLEYGFLEEQHSG